MQLIVQVGGPRAESHGKALPALSVHSPVSCTTPSPSLHLHMLALQMGPVPCVLALKMKTGKLVLPHQLSLSMEKEGRKSLEDIAAGRAFLLLLKPLPLTEKGDLHHVSPTALESFHTP